MSKVTGERRFEPANGPANLHDAIDRWGPDLRSWPDMMLIRQAREALLADRNFRQYRDRAVAEAERLERAAQSIDRRIAESGSVERITRKLLEATGSKVIHWRRRIGALAAVMVVSAALGSAFAEMVPVNAEQPSYDVVQLDTLVFGPSEADF